MAVIENVYNFRSVQLHINMCGRLTARDWTGFILLYLPYSSLLTDHAAAIQKTQKPLHRLEKGKILPTHSDCHVTGNLKM